MKNAQKLARVAKMHFAKQRISATGPRLPNRQAMFNKLLQSEAIQRAIEDEAKSKNISIEKAQKEAHKILDEIAADVSHSSLRAADRFLRWLWNKLYSGIDVQNADRVRKLALEVMRLFMCLATVVISTIYCFLMCFIIKGLFHRYRSRN